MKVTPIAGPSLGTADIGSGSTSPDRKEAAKQAYLGQTGTTITPAEKPAPQDPHGAKKVIKMNVNRTPGLALQEALDSAQPQESPESAISDETDEVEPEVRRPVSPQLAALAKQRRQLQVMEQEIAKREQALKERSGQDAGINLERLKSNPLEVLKQAGVTYENLTEAILAEQSGVSPELLELRQKVADLEKGFDEKLSARDEQVEKQVLSEIQREADRLVQSDPEFEMIRGTNSQKKVTELVHKIWKTSGEVIDVDEAAKLIEDQLVEDNLKAASFNKIRSRLTPEVVQTPAQKPYGLRTLTNRDTAARPMSAKARAIAAFNGNIKR